MVRGVVLTLRDVSERRLWMEQLTQRALHDELTGLANRATFMEHLTSHVASREHAGALLYIDVNDFKAINDTHGHTAGDLVLRTIAGEIVSSVRPEDICGRLGGDEFAVLAKSVTGAAQAAALVDRVAAAVSHPVEVDSTVTVRPNASIGVALLADTRDADLAIHVADADMYRRKPPR
jgi:diguanylate cyclase (GGDEF)-like protein